MIDFETVNALVQASTTITGSLGELKESLEYDSGLQQVSQGAHTASDALSTYQIRAASAERSGVDVQGMEHLLQALAQLPASEPLVVCHYGTPHRLFSVFVGGGGIVGCVSVPRRFSGV